MKGANLIKPLRLNGRNIGQGFPVYIIAEIGINHNGSLKNAKQLIDVASQAGCDAVKFQKRTPEICVPENQREIMRETPWGYISYMEYREKVEFDYDQYAEIVDYCQEKKIQWFASCWDEPSVDFIDDLNPPCYKIPSAHLTNHKLLEYNITKGKPILLSTGMSTIKQIKAAVDVLGETPKALLHCTSTYPCPIEEINLNMIKTLAKQFNCIIGYSGHETGLPTTVAAVALGAHIIERHITLDRSTWGSDQSASIEPGGLKRLVDYIRVIEKSMGDGIKRIYKSEKKILERLRTHK